MGIAYMADAAYRPAFKHLCELAGNRLDVVERAVVACRNEVGATRQYSAVAAKLEEWAPEGLQGRGEAPAQ